MTDRPIIPVCDLRPQITALRSEIDAALARVLERGWFILGEEVKQFEVEFARWLGAGSVIGVASGTDAIHLALRALGVGAGDRVLTAPNSANPTACGITLTGAEPRFADVNLQSGQLDLESVAAALKQERIRVLMPVHLYGDAAPLAELQALATHHGATLLEDAAQAHGTRIDGAMAGTVASLGCFSFYPSKNLGAYGDGGAVATQNPELADRLRMLRNYGQRDRYHHESFGMNSRLDEMQAAILRVKLRYLDQWNERRRALADIYRNRLADLPLALPPPDRGEDRSCHHLFVVRVARRDRLRAELLARGVGTEIHYPVPIHLQPAYAGLELGPGTFPNAERRAGQIVSLPLYPELTDENLEQVSNALAEALAGEPHPDEEV